MARAPLVHGSAGPGGKAAASQSSSALTRAASPNTTKLGDSGHRQSGANAWRSFVRAQSAAAGNQRVCDMWRRWRQSEREENPPSKVKPRTAAMRTTQSTTYLQPVHTHAEGTHRAHAMELPLSLSLSLSLRVCVWPTKRRAVASTSPAPREKCRGGTGGRPNFGHGTESALSLQSTRLPDSARALSSETDNACMSAQHNAKQLMAHVKQTLRHNRHKHPVLLRKQRFVGTATRQTAAAAAAATAMENEQFHVSQQRGNRLAGGGGHEQQPHRRA